jgi:hypothetical protein
MCMHTASLSVYISNKSQCKKIICSPATGITVSGSCHMLSNAWTNPTSICFCQLQVTILMTLCPCNALHFYIHVGICMSWSVFHCGYQHQVLTVRRFHNYLHNPDTICWNHYTVTDNVLPFCKILGQPLCPKVKVFLTR